jgi:hypothetical protein
MLLPISKILYPSDNFSNWCYKVAAPFVRCWSLCSINLLVQLGIVRVCVRVHVHVDVRDRIRVQVHVHVHVHVRGYACGPVIRY